MQNSAFRIVLLGAITGLAAGAFVILFRLCIELSQGWLLPDGKVGNFEALPGWQRFLLPVAGAAVLGLIFNRLPAHLRSVGVTHVIDFLRYRKQRLPFRNAIVQFFAGIAVLLSGHSVDREGPGVHLGSATVGLLGKRTLLTTDDHYLLAAAGGAAAIAAAYNTPLAGVIFVVEVFRIRYSISNIVPIIVAAVTGTIISRLLYGHYTAFALPDLAISSMAELPLVIFMGLIIGLIAAAFIKTINITARMTLHLPPLPLFLIAGTVTGILAQWSPEIMGLSYDALNRILNDQIGLQALLLLLLAKFIATAVAIGARIPGGLIGPSLILGAAVGGLSEILAHDWYPFFKGSIGIYAMIGMVAMMGAILRAPLAALIALMELTGNLNIILPGMMAVVSAEITVRSLVGDQSAFTTLLEVKHEREAKHINHEHSL